jgi:hypothetical protein
MDTLNPGFLLFFIMKLPVASMLGNAFNIPNIPRTVILISLKPRRITEISLIKLKNYVEIPC